MTSSAIPAIPYVATEQTISLLRERFYGMYTSWAYAISQSKLVAESLPESQRKSDRNFERHKIRSPAALTTSARGSSGGQFDPSESAENHKDGMQRRNGSRDRLNATSTDAFLYHLQ